MLMFEKALEQSLFKKDPEKSFIDKLLAKNDVEKVRELMKKDNLTRSELLELLYQCTSNEIKLVNLGSRERYILLKFFVWIRETIKIAEIMYDNQDYLQAQEKQGIIMLSPRCKKILKNNERLMEHNIKFLIDMYFIIARSTMSLGGTGFMELLKNKFEIAYPNMAEATANIESPQAARFRGK